MTSGDMNKKALFTHEKDEYSTPQDLFDELNKEFNFQLDPCSTDKNAKCFIHYTLPENPYLKCGLQRQWYHMGSIFVNPPYSCGNIEKWVCKSYEESRNGCTVVMLLPVTTGTAIWHDIIFPCAAEIRFLKGRVKFTLNGVEQGTPRFDSAIVIFRPPVIQGKYKYRSNP